jgi:mono/diheme cytochrome c family protein
MHDPNEAKQQRTIFRLSALYPAIGVLAVVSAVAFLILQLTLRPWSTSSYSPEAHFNLVALPEDYNRSPLSYVSASDTGQMNDWVASDYALEHEDVEYALYVAYACAACHGTEGEGVPAGPPVAGIGERRSTNLTRQGPGNMPAYGDDYLPQTRLDSINAYIGRFEEIPEATPLPVTPTATPWPLPTPTPTPTPTPSPTPMPTPTAVPPGVPTPTPTAEPTALPTSTPIPTPDPSRLAKGEASYLDWGCDLCHGVDGAGAEDGPTVLGLSATDLRDLTRKPVREADSPYPKAMDDYPLSKLSEEELADLVYYMLHLSSP